MGIAARHRSFLLALWLCLATALAHSVLPVGSPLTPRHGSAFSASTSDVALGPNRRHDNGNSAQLRVDGDDGDQLAGGGAASLPATVAEPRPVPGDSGAVRFAALPAPRGQAFVPGARPRAPPPTIAA